MRRASTAARGYDRHWQRLRARYLVQHPRCQVGGCTEPSVDVDHIVSVRAAPHLRLVWSNLTALCHRHHSSVTNGFDKGSIKGACDADGYPLDPAHPWAAAAMTNGVASSSPQDSVRRAKPAVVLRQLKREWLSRHGKADDL